MNENQVIIDLQSKSEKHAIIEMKFLKDCPYFKGHFDDFKLLAAFVQLKYVTKLSGLHLGINPEKYDFPTLKFMNPIYPNQKLKLELKKNSKKKEIIFSYLDAKTNKPHSSGTWRYE